MPLAKRRVCFLAWLPGFCVCGVGGLSECSRGGRARRRRRGGGGWRPGRGAPAWATICDSGSHDVHAGGRRQATRQRAGRARVKLALPSTASSRAGGCCIPESTGAWGWPWCAPRLPRRVAVKGGLPRSWWAAGTLETGTQAKSAQAQRRRSLQGPPSTAGAARRHAALTHAAAPPDHLPPLCVHAYSTCQRTAVP